MDTVVSVNEQKMPKLDCTDAHSDLDLGCPQMNTDGLQVSLDSVKIILFVFL